jgi:predicted nucleic acid-binding protein
MIILDTNVISALMLSKPDRTIIQWFEQQDIEDLYTTSITIGELLAGQSTMPNGRRKNELLDSIQKMVEFTFEKRILPFDTESAAFYAICVSLNKQSGLNVTSNDSQIAAICRQYEATLVTRNLKDFMHLGIVLVNPWEEGERL